MLKETGRVIDIDPDGLWVETLKTSACSACSARAGCGQKVLAKAAEGKMSRVKAYFSGQMVTEGLSRDLIIVSNAGGVHLESGPNQQWSVGDDVEIGISEDSLVTATLIVYMLPLCLMVLGASLFSWVADVVLQDGGAASSDIVSIVGAALGLIAGAFISRWHSAKNTMNCRFHAVVLGRP